MLRRTSAVVACLLASLTAAPAGAQTPDTDYEPPPQTEPAKVPATGFLMPDVPIDRVTHAFHTRLQWVY